MKQIILTVAVVAASLLVFGQSSDSLHKIMFYNVENLFHPSDDSLTNDDDFTPSGNYHWTYKKYYRKISMIGKVIVALGEGDPPWIVGLAEIENERVLRDLCNNSPLQRFGYGYVHFDSPDKRGVDVALLYRKDYVAVLKRRAIPIVFPFEPDTRNRDVLHVTLGFPSGDSIEVFVNHWTSRFGGYAATVPKRNHYASVVRRCVDSVMNTNKKAKILIMGDFNDYADNESIARILLSYPDGIDSCAKLFNLAAEYQRGNAGTHKHEDFWGCLDQMMASGTWLSADESTRQVGGMGIYAPDFLLVDDEKYGGKKNYRTFSGPRYFGGFSDHLPIYVLFRDG